MSIPAPGKWVKGLRDPVRAVRYVRRKTKHRWLLRKAPDIFERDWDVLVVLDACRYDTLRDAAADRENYGEVGSYVSVAGHSFGWLSYYQNELARDGTVYVSSNPHTANILDGECVEVWRTHWDDDLGTVRAEDVTDIAVHHYQSVDPGRMVVHYMQPHFPSIPEPEYGVGIELDQVGEDEDGWEGSVWNMLENGEIDVEPVREAYEANLEYVLDEVDVLASAIDAGSIVVTADHGNAFEGPYGHPIESGAKQVRSVPWVRARGIECPQRDPDRTQSTLGGPTFRDAKMGAREATKSSLGGPSTRIQEKLEALGYK